MFGHEQSESSEIPSDRGHAAGRRCSHSNGFKMMSPATLRIARRATIAL